MNKYFTTIFSIVLLPLFFLTFLISANEVSAKKGTLVIITKDKNKKKINAPVFLNGKKKGKGKVTLKLKPKKYKIKFGDFEGYEIVKPAKGRKTVKVKKGKKKTIKGIYKKNAGILPTASFSFNPSAGDVFAEFTFDASGSTDAEDSLSDLKFRWDFDGDGTWDSSYTSTTTVTHTYYFADTYTATLSVKDSGADTSTAEKSITVTSFGGGTNGGNALQPVPDTGQTTDYTGTFGEDSDYTINTPSYTDNSDGTISDTITGLMWQKMTDGTARNFSDAKSYCDNLTLAGYDDWRLPTWKELVGIVDYGKTNPALDSSVFTGTNITSFHWSYTTDASGGWRVGFFDGYAEGALESTEYVVRAVRGGIKKESFTDNEDSTVTDNGTGLMWYQTTAGPMTWTSALDYCETLDAGGHTDWRLPTIKELASILDNTKLSPAIDTAIFPGASSRYWASTVFAQDNSLAWAVSFNTGGTLETTDKSVSTSNVLAVRGEN